ncbi:hypothetical protein [Puniceicoccus vermicola]|uniref:DUF4369 domain-containing protein n=1 Tax=Puniceicoccus vermicola TaxID=388746 RepID=A0A7X1AV56_9BACT|nr:hypothetical protein [Puniceicoccus vermicola]MBC2600595.1 hypothetical protein [Puniceicoccus vermicola]
MITKRLVFLTLILGISGLTAAPRKVVSITNTEGVTIEAEIISVVRSKNDVSWLCFRKPKGKDFYLYPFASLTRSSLDLLSTTFQGNELVVVDGLTGPQLDMLDEYLAASPRERLVLEVQDARKRERLLSREWKRLQNQTWQIQQQLAGIQDPQHRVRVAALFQQSLRARDRTGKRLVLLQAEIRRMEERIDLLKSMGVPIEDDPFADSN